MINDIRYTASQLLELTNNIPIQLTNINTSQPNTESFEELMVKNNNTSNKTDNSSKSIFGSLGIPAGFNIDFSMLEEMENENISA